MEDLLRRMQAIPKSRPFGIHPRNRGQGVRQCPILPRQTVEVRQAVGRVEVGKQRNALTWESQPEGNVVYLWEFHAPRGYTVRAVLLPAPRPSAVVSPPRPAAGR